MRVCEARGLRSGREEAGRERERERETKHMRKYLQFTQTSILQDLKSASLAVRTHVSLDSTDSLIERAEI